jgi:hypothetical protein
VETRCTVLLTSSSMFPLGLTGSSRLMHHETRWGGFARVAFLYTHQYIDSVGTRPSYQAS